MLKNAYLLEKTVKVALALRDPPPAAEALPAYYDNFVEFVSSAKCVLLLSKQNKITTVNVLLLLLLHLFSLQFKLCSFCGQEAVSCPRAQRILAMPLM